MLGLEAKFRFGGMSKRKRVREKNKKVLETKIRADRERNAEEQRGTAREDYT